LTMSCSFVLAPARAEFLSSVTNEKEGAPLSCCAAGGRLERQKVRRKTNLPYVCGLAFRSPCRRRTGSAQHSSLSFTLPHVSQISSSGSWSNANAGGQLADGLPCTCLHGPRPAAVMPLCASISASSAAWAAIKPHQELLASSQRLLASTQVHKEQAIGSFRLEAQK
jgi:hypothetical protein